MAAVKTREGGNMVKIRQETERDRAAVYDVVREAFLSAEHSDGSEHDLVNALRTSDAFVPELSLVAEEGGSIVGHVLFTKARIGASTQLALAPLSVLPAWQRRGIGSALVQEGHDIARSLGFDYSIVLGSERYYPRFGYVPAREYGITAPFDALDENFMACKLRDDAPAVAGTVVYAPEFGIG